jgi:hypothetical protein
MNAFASAFSSTKGAFTSAFESAANSFALVDAVFASGAGSTDVNGLYLPDGMVAGRTRYTRYVSASSFVWNGEEYVIRYGSGFGDVQYSSDNIAGAPNSNPWDGIYITSGDGSDPPPTVRQATTADGFNPPVPNPAMWLSDTGYDRSVWPDLSGNNRNAIQGTSISRPEIVANVRNGRQIRRFDGVDDFYTHSYSVSGDNTIFAVCYSTQTTTGNSTIFSAAAISADLKCFMIPQSAINNNWGTYRTSIISSGYTLRSSFEVISIVSTAAGVSLKHGSNAAQFTADTNYYNDPTSSRRTIGAAYDGGASMGMFNFKGDIAEILIYSTALSDTDRQSVESYLRNKWSVA